MITIGADTTLCKSILRTRLPQRLALKVRLDTSWYLRRASAGMQALQAYYIIGHLIRRDGQGYVFMAFDTSGKSADVYRPLSGGFSVPRSVIMHPGEEEDQCVVRLGSCDPSHPLSGNGSL